MPVKKKPILPLKERALKLIMQKYPDSKVLLQEDDFTIIMYKKRLTVVEKYGENSFSPQEFYKEGDYCILHLIHYSKKELSKVEDDWIKMGCLFARLIIDEKK